MDDLAPAPAQRTFDGVGRSPEENFTARKKAAKKVPAAPAKREDPEPEITPDADPEADHELDLLA